MLHGIGAMQEWGAAIYGVFQLTWEASPHGVILCTLACSGPRERHTHQELISSRLVDAVVQGQWFKQHQGWCACIRVHPCSWRFGWLVTHLAQFLLTAVLISFMVWRHTTVTRKIHAKNCHVLQISY